MPTVKQVVMIAVSLMVVALILPLALGLLGGADLLSVSINGTSYAITDLVDSSVLTMLTVLIPILAIVGIAIGYIHYSD